MKIKTRSGSHETQREWVYHRIHNLALLRALRVRDGHGAARAVAAEITVGSRMLERLMAPDRRARI